MGNGDWAQSPIDNIYLKYIKNNLYLIIDNIFYI